MKRSCKNRYPPPFRRVSIALVERVLTVRGSFRAMVGRGGEGGEGEGEGGPLVFNVNSQIGEGQG